MRIIGFCKSYILKYRTFITYYFVGNICVLIDFAFLYTFTEFFRIYYLISASLSFIVSSFTGYILNKNITFNNKSKKYLHQYLLVIVSGLIYMLLNALFLLFLVEKLHLWYIYARIISLIVLLYYSYSFNKYITFGMIK